MSSRLSSLSFVVVVWLACALCGRANAQSPPPMRRIAVLVGSNDAPAGRQALRFAHADAQQFADVLTRVGRFARSDVHVLLDPQPAELEAALYGASRDAADAKGDALFVFYYSGHSDGQAVYPRGEPLSLADLRRGIESVGARIRVGILDTCRGGSWTQAKGLSVGPPLDPVALLDVGTEGTALVSSSSGLENAHESDSVNGSFFTHHFIAGLLGAADRSGDGNVTLEEAFDYAKERTVRDSARMAAAPQHPSFDLQLRGRQDVVLTSIPSGAGALEVTQANAPIEVIHLPSGITVAEAPPGPGPVRIAVPPAHYLVRSVVGDRVLSREADVRDGETVLVSGGQLEATDDARLAVKGTEPLPPETIEEPPLRWGAELGLAFGVPVGAAFGGESLSEFASGLFDLEGAVGLVFFRRLVLGIHIGVGISIPAALPSVPWTYDFGVQGEYRFLPAPSQINPWVGLGLTFEALNMHGENHLGSLVLSSSDVDLTGGFDFQRPEADAHAIVGPFGLGPFVTYRYGKYSPPADAPTASHGWVLLGVRARY